MNQKKCPKCGENNPVEGVMCWACYTPLSGGASAGAKTGAAASLAAPPVVEEKEKTKITPVQMGVLGVGLLVLVGMGLRSLGGGATLEDPVVLPDVPGGSSPNFRPPVVPVRPGQPAPPVTQLPQVTAPPGEVMAYSVTTPPSPRSPWATVGIVPSAAGTDRVTAGRMASLAHKPFARTGRWQGVFVYAFADKQTAAVFQKYQQNRRGAPLEPDDYEDQSLQGIWPKTLARYEFSRGEEAIRYPQTDPQGWFRGGSKWTKAAR